MYTVTSGIIKSVFGYRFARILNKREEKEMNESIS
jgi:hypothetical protein